MCSPIRDPAAREDRTHDHSRTHNSSSATGAERQLNDSNRIPQLGDAIRASELAREEPFVTTKLASGDHGRDAALRAFESSLDRLCFNYVDLYLIHWPIPSQDLYVETWQTLTELKADGRAHSIGVGGPASPQPLPTR
ncbi:MAG: aldo/keto reductase [Solirubrobacteraceae bacterium]